MGVSAHAQSALFFSLFARGDGVRRLQLREPLLKLLHLMRAMEYTATDERELELVDLQESIGMQSYASPTVFSFFLPEYEPAGPVASWSP